MLDTFKKLLTNQFEATLCTLAVCVDRCPDTAWNAPVVNLQFCQVAFHTLFFADYYLGQNEAALRQQPFHEENASFFRDYEELEDRKPILLYEKPPIKTYLAHCRAKSAQVISTETAETLDVGCGFERRDISRAELYVLNIRHIHHHTAQLSLRLRIDFAEEIPWIGSGWSDV